MSIDRWMNKEDGSVYTMEYYSAIKRWNLSIWNNIEAIYYAKWDKSNGKD